MEKRSIGLFIDAQNMFTALRSAYGGKGKINYVKMADYFARRGDLVVRVLVTSRKDDGAADKFLQTMGYQNFRAIGVNDDGKRDKTDMVLAIEIMLAADRLDEVVIASGDGDMLPVVNALVAKGKIVSIVGWSTATSLELVRLAHNFYPIEGIPGAVILEDGEAEAAPAVKTNGDAVAEAAKDNGSRPAAEAETREPGAASRVGGGLAAAPSLQNKWGDYGPDRLYEWADEKRIPKPDFSPWMQDVLRSLDYSACNAMTPGFLEAYCQRFYWLPNERLGGFVTRLANWIASFLPQSNLPLVFSDMVNASYAVVSKTAHREMHDQFGLSTLRLFALALWLAGLDNKIGIGLMPDNSILVYRRDSNSANLVDANIEALAMDTLAGVMLKARRAPIVARIFRDDDPASIMERSAEDLKDWLAKEYKTSEPHYADHRPPASGYIDTILNITRAYVLYGMPWDQNTLEEVIKMLALARAGAWLRVLPEERFKQKVAKRFSLPVPSAAG